MGSWRKVGAFLGLVPDDGRHDEFGEDYHDDGDHDDYARDPRSADYGAPDYAPADYGDEDFDRGRQPAHQPPAPRQVPVGYAAGASTQGSLAVQPRADLRREAESAGAIRPVTVKLTGFSEARVIGEKFREGKPVILDMTEMDDANARRLVDFAAGLAFALRGSIDKVTAKVFMLLPPDTDVADIPSYQPEHAGFTGGYGPDTSVRDRQAYAGVRASR